METLFDKLLLTLPEDFEMSDMLDLEAHEPNASIVYDVRAYRGAMEIDHGNLSNWGQHFKLTWLNPPPICLVGQLNRYYLINKKEYLYTPSRVVEVKETHGDIIVTLDGRFISMDSMRKYLTRQERTPRFTCGRYFSKVQDRLLQEERAREFFDY